MRRNNRRRQGGSKWVRPVDWDFAHFSGVLGDGQSTYDWLRVPSDNDDPLNGLFIGPKTLVRTMVRGHLQTNLAPDPPNANVGTFYFGAIAWTGNTNPPVNPVPNMENGSADWIFYLPVTMTLAGTGTQQYLTTELGANAGESGWLISRAMRKLPPTVGILFGAYYDGGLGINTIVGFNIAFRMALKGDVSVSGLGGG